MGMAGTYERPVVSGTSLHGCLAALQVFPQESCLLGQGPFQSPLGVLMEVGTG